MNDEVKEPKYREMVSYSYTLGGRWTKVYDEVEVTENTEIYLEEVVKDSYVGVIPAPMHGYGSRPQIIDVKTKELRDILIEQLYNKIFDRDARKIDINDTVALNALVEKNAKECIEYKKYCDRHHSQSSESENF